LNSISFNTPQLRQLLRQKRRHLSAIEQQGHSLRITKRIIYSRFIKHSKHIALYLPSDGEVDLTPLILRLFNQFNAGKKHCYLPVIVSRRDAIIRFAPFEPGSKMRKNCFSIDEPVYQRRQLKSAAHMDLILAPLVGFDAEGNRIGMGGGYYDRALQHLKPKSEKGHSIIKPRFVGIAHAIQKVEKLDRQQWDIPLHAIVTEQELSYFK
jgi:5-formyltetrahydrofolate cyclo-ligase